jgi:hypothetical protein
MGNATQLGQLDAVGAATMSSDQVAQAAALRQQAFVATQGAVQSHTSSQLTIDAEVNKPPGKVGQADPKCTITPDVEQPESST